MMELEVGGIYTLERQPMKAVKLHDRNSDGGRNFYQSSMYAKILVITKPKRKKRGRGIRYVVYFFPGVGRHQHIDCLYSEWIKKASFLKKERDMSKWPPLAKQNFLMSKGAMPEPCKFDNIEEAQMQIAQKNRRRRIKQENHEKQRKEALKKGTAFITVEHGSTTTANYSDYASAGSAMHLAIGSDKPESPKSYDCEFEELDPVDEDMWYEESMCADEGPEEATNVEPQPAPKGAPEPLKAGYLGYRKNPDWPKPKKRKKKRRKKKKSVASKIEHLHHMYTVADFDEHGMPAVTSTNTEPKRSKGELLEIVENPSFTPEFREQAANELEEMKKQEEEINQLIKYANKQMEKKKETE